MGRLDRVHINSLWVSKGEYFSCARFYRDSIKVRVDVSLKTDFLMAIIDKQLQNEMFYGNIIL